MTIILWWCWCAILTHISVSTKSTTPVFCAKRRISLPGSERGIAATATAPLACGVGGRCLVFWIRLNSNTYGGFNPYQYCTEGIQYYPIYDLVVSNSSFFQPYLGWRSWFTIFFWGRHPTRSHPQYGNPGNLPGVFRCHIFVCWNLVVFTFSVSLASGYRPCSTEILLENEHHLFFWSSTVCCFQSVAAKWTSQNIERIHKILPIIFGATMPSWEIK